MKFNCLNCSTYVDSKQKRKFCSRCNYMVGAAKDRIELLKARIEYLEQFYAYRGLL